MINDLCNYTNFTNTKIDGTFDEWIESIKAEIEEMLIPVNEDDTVYPVTITPDDWGREGNSMPAKIISLGSIYFGFAKQEFEHCKANPKHIMRLVNTRYIDMLWSIECIREKYFKLLRRFDPKHETPNDYLH